MQKENENRKELSFPRNVVGNLPLSGSLIKEEKQLYLMKQVEDPRQKPSGMTDFFYHDEKAFTLIELLVVVLIIGILAAVALPQYQNVVWKSRGTQLYVAVQALHTAQKAYYLANGTWATTFDELSIEMPFQQACKGGDAAGYTNNTATDCLRNKYGFVYLYPSGASRAMFCSDSPKYRWCGFYIAESETSEYQDELMCTDISNGKKSFCALMGYTTKISCNNNGVCVYRK